MQNTSTQFLMVEFCAWQGNWNYFAAIRSEKRGAKLEATHLEKAKELYTKVCFPLFSYLKLFNHLYSLACLSLSRIDQIIFSKDFFFFFVKNVDCPFLSPLVFCTWFSISQLKLNIFPRTRSCLQMSRECSIRIRQFMQKLSVSLYVVR